MEYKQLIQGVAGQLTPEDISDLRVSGIKTLICNRPDGEAQAILKGREWLVKPRRVQ